MPMQATFEPVAWLKGPSCHCENLPPLTCRPWRLVLLGPPGVGKGTQATLWGQKYNCCQLSTGDLFRAAKQQKPEERTPAMNEAIAYMSRGELVPDATVLEVVRERAHCLKCERGFQLDGFPRTVPQAAALKELLREQGVELDGVVSLEMDLETNIARLAGRRTCSSCKAIYQLQTRPPKVEGICDKCGGKLFQREDDRPEAIRVRMATYDKETSPLIEYYRKEGLLVPVFSHYHVEDTLAESIVKLEAHAQARAKRTATPA